MSTNTLPELTESELLYEYLGVQLKKGGREKPVREVLSGYVQYRRQLGELRERLRAAEASSARGESAELDVEELIAEVTEQLAAEGIT